MLPCLKNWENHLLVNPKARVGNSVGPVFKSVVGLKSLVTWEDTLINLSKVILCVILDEVG